MVAFVIACRKAQMKPFERKVAADVLKMIFENGSHRVFREANAKNLFTEKFLNALKEFGFDYSEPEVARLPQDNFYYDEVEKTVSICLHVASAPSAVMIDFTSLFDRYEGAWDVWDYLRQLGDKDIQNAYELFSASKQGEKLLWSSQLNVMKGVNPQLKKC